MKNWQYCTLIGFIVMSPNDPHISNMIVGTLALIGSIYYSIKEDKDEIQ